MLKNFFKYNVKKYWRNIDKTIFVSFLLLFILGIFFSFSSTSLLAGERLNKDYYFFFFEASSLCNVCNFSNDFNFHNSVGFI